MKGYSETALMLLPSMDNFHTLNLTEKNYVDSAVTNMAEFLVREFGVKPYVIVSDDYYIDSRKDFPHIQFSSLPKEDLRFAKSNCDGMDFIDIDAVAYAPNEILQKARQKYPINGVLNRDARFEVVLSREKIVMKEYIKQSKLVVSFENINKMTWNTQRNLTTDRLVIHVSPVNGMCSAFFCGEQISLQKLTNLKYTAFPVYNWEGKGVES